MNNRESYHTCIDILRETEQYNFDILYIITKKEHDKRQYRECNIKCVNR